MPKRGNVEYGYPKATSLWLTLDRKVSPDGFFQVSRKRWVPTVPNSFGLPSGVSCPGKTAFCESCYAVGTENMQGVRAKMEHNLQLLHQAGTVEAMASLLTQMVSRFARHVRQFKRVRLRRQDRVFRIHWDGDFFSEEYAEAWAQTVQRFPDVQFWAYTRSFLPPVNVVPILSGIDNLALYLSADEHNADAALDLVGYYPDVHLALCAVDYRSARKLSTERVSVICPENIGRMPLMANGRGACVECRICVDGKQDVIFSTSHREDASLQLAIDFVDKTGMAVTDCRNPDCSETVRYQPGRGRPKEFCSRRCRLRCAYLRRREKNKQES